MKRNSMNIWTRCMAVLALMCLLVSMVPSVAATEVNEEARKGLDYSELELQVAIANGLTSYGYTKESWEKLQKVLEVGNMRLAGIYDQGKLDAAADDIADALADLVKMDYSALNKALDAVKAKENENPQLHDVWYRLDNAADEAKALLISGDQAAVNAAADQINDLLEELEQQRAATVETEVVIQEVEVEVLPTDDFCNMPAHRTWPILFTISATLNVGLLAALVFVIMRKRNTSDNTPLVNYDIDDDMDF